MNVKYGFIAIQTVLTDSAMGNPFFAKFGNGWQTQS
jgi:biotin transporter BioY